MYGSQVISASVSRLRTHDRELVVRHVARGQARCLSGSWNRAAFSSLLRHREDVGDVELVDRPDLDADRPDQHQPRGCAPAPWWRFRRRSSRRPSSRPGRPSPGRAGPSARDRCARCRRRCRSSRAARTRRSRDATARSPACCAPSRSRNRSAGSTPCAPCRNRSGAPAPRSNSSSSTPAIERVVRARSLTAFMFVVVGS